MEQLVYPPTVPSLKRKLSVLAKYNVVKKKSSIVTCSNHNIAEKGQLGVKQQSLIHSMMGHDLLKYGILRSLYLIFEITLIWFTQPFIILCIFEYNKFLAINWYTPSYIIKMIIWNYLNMVWFNSALNKLLQKNFFETGSMFRQTICVNLIISIVYQFLFRSMFVVHF